MKVAVFIDGGHLRSYAKKAGKTFDQNFVSSVAQSCVNSGEHLFRVLYYDCEPFCGQVKLPVSGSMTQLGQPSNLLKNLAKQELVAVRRGVLKFRGWERKQSSFTPGAPNPLTDADFKPRFEQKGVDLRIGLDLITMADNGAVDIMILMTGDTDLIPALKIVRTKGFQVAGVNLPNYTLIDELRQHVDLFRTVSSW